MMAAYLSLLDVYGAPTALDRVLATGDDTLGEALGRASLRQRARPERESASADEWEI